MQQQITPELMAYYREKASSQGPEDYYTSTMRNAAVNATRANQFNMPVTEVPGGGVSPAVEASMYDAEQARYLGEAAQNANMMSKFGLGGLIPSDQLGFKKGVKEGNGISYIQKPQVQKGEVTADDVDEMEMAYAIAEDIANGRGEYTAQEKKEVLNDPDISHFFKLLSK